jgi:hypothetical protein
MAGRQRGAQRGGRRRECARTGRCVLAVGDKGDGSWAACPSRSERATRFLVRDLDRAGSRHASCWAIRGSEELVPLQT